MSRCIFVWWPIRRLQHEICSLFALAQVNRDLLYMSAGCTAQDLTGCTGRLRSQTEESLQRDARCSCHEGKDGRWRWRRRRRRRRVRGCFPMSVRAFPCDYLSQLPIHHYPIIRNVSGAIRVLADFLWRNRLLRRNMLVRVMYIQVMNVSFQAFF